MEMLQDEFGVTATEWYLDRIDERIFCGKVYHNPLKTAYIWATNDRKFNRGFYSTYNGYARRRKSKNHGRS